MITGVSCVLALLFAILLATEAEMKPTDDDCPLFKLDACGVCMGDNSTCAGCDGIPHSNAADDACGVCLGNNSTCAGCDGVPNSGKRPVCGVCDGPPTCVGCDGVEYSGAKKDLCGVCLGSNSCIPPKPDLLITKTIDVVWGLQGIDRSQVNPNDPTEDRGMPIYDTTFDLSDPRTQLFLYHVCANVSANERLVLMVNVFAQFESRCFIYKFRQQRLSESKSFPVPKEEFLPLLVEFLTQNREFARDVGFEISNNGTSFRPIWVRFSFRSLVRKDSAFVASYPYFLLWEETVNALMASGPSTANKAFQNSDMWVTVLTERTVVLSVASGLAISGSITFLSVLVFTGNVFTSLIAMTSIAGTTVCIAAFYWIFGWSVGVLEAISLSILIGLTVDYCLHLAETYHHGEREGRGERVRYALYHVAAPVIGGGLTTIASSAMLLFCQVRMFSGFGLIVVVNTVLSLLFSLFFFCALMALIGPTGNVGRVMSLIERIPAYRRLQSRCVATSTGAESAQQLQPLVANAAEDSWESSE